MKSFMNTTALVALGLLVIAVLNSGCSSLVRNRDEQSVSAIKKVALVAFSSYEPVSPSIMLNLSKGKTEGMAGGSIGSKDDDTIAQMYSDLRESLIKNMGWEVPASPALTGNSDYTAAYKKTMEGWQNKMPAGKGTQQYGLNGIMDFDSARILGQAGRDQLIDALGVDALVAVRIDVHLNGFSVMGVGSSHPQAHVAFFVYKKGSDKPVWFDGGLEGEEATESVGATAFIDNDLVKKLSAVSARTAFNKIGK